MTGMGYLVRFYKENGFYVTFRACAATCAMRMRSFLTALKLGGAYDMLIGRSPYIRGLSHISIGKGFAAGVFLRLEAITAHNGVVFNPRIIIKDNVQLSDFVHIGATNYVEIGNNVRMASKIYITDHNHGVYDGSAQTGPAIAPKDRILSCRDKVIIKDNVWIGEMVSVLPGVTIGEGSIIGANSVVTKDVPPYVIAVGNPAKAVKKFSLSSGKWEAIR